MEIVILFSPEMITVWGVIWFQELIQLYVKNSVQWQREKRGREESGEGGNGVEHRTPWGGLGGVAGHSFQSENLQRRCPLLASGWFLPFHSHSSKCIV